MNGLNVQNITVSFGGLNALQNLNASAELGKITGLIGPNGAGKTTLINCLTGYCRPGSGDIRFDGQSIENWSTARIRKFGVTRTFQSARLFDNLTAMENVEAAALALGLSRREARIEAEEALALVGLHDLNHENVSGLPYVTQRLLGIARAIVGKPHYLLLDEPAAGMSDVEAGQLLALLRELQASYENAILLVEHNMDLIMRCCDYIHVFDGGRNIAAGTPAQIQTNPDVIRAYLGAV